MSFWYLATPYSKYPLGIEEAFKEACYAAGELIQAGVPVFSPIAHTHPIAVETGIDPYDYDIWLPADEPFVRTACGLIVYELDGWDTSVGVLGEIEAFRNASKPIVYWELDQPVEGIARYAKLRVAL